MFKNILIVGVLLLALFAGVSLLNKNSSDVDLQSTESGTNTNTSGNSDVNTLQNELVKDMPTEVTTTTMEESPMVIDVEGGAFYFNPNEIRVKAGTKVKIVLTSVDMMHDFNIDELNVKSEIVKAGNTGTVEFVATEVGEYEYYCSVGQHRVNGQIGKLIVE